MPRTAETGAAWRGLDRLGRKDPERIRVLARERRGHGSLEALWLLRENPVLIGQTEKNFSPAIALRLTLEIIGASSAVSRYHADPDSSDDPLGTSTILPVTPPFPSNSCACLASARGNRCAMSGLIFCC